MFFGGMSLILFFFGLRSYLFCFTRLTSERSLNSLYLAFNISFYLVGDYGTGISLSHSI
ncbi:hypothetical protein QFZ77_002884 [Paenibacillus sp. V4I3]|nr:hypothetical protein [Paenibacillus sp. V4I3]